MEEIWGVLAEKRRRHLWAEICFGWLFFHKQFTVGFFLRRKKAGRDMLWPPCVRHCPPCVRLDSALAAFLHFVRLVSVVCPPCVRLKCAWPRLQTLSALCPPVLCARPRFYTLSAMCQPMSAICPPCDRRLGSALAPPPKLACHFSWPAVGHRVYIACPLVSFLGIHFGSTNFCLCKSTVCLKNCFGVFAGIILSICRDHKFLLHFSLLFVLHFSRTRLGGRGGTGADAFCLCTFEAHGGRQGVMAPKGAEPKKVTLI